jgi:hypothetical protein
MIVKETAESQAVKPAILFGEKAVEMGFISINQLQEALDIQRNIDIISGAGAHKRIGDILFEKGWLTVKQIYIVQRKVFEHVTD